MLVALAGVYDLTREYPIRDEGDRRFVEFPDGRLMEVDFEGIHRLALSGGLFGRSEEQLLFVRYVLGEADD